ncbi:hypothetical protein [Variovorax saccharolyticus]|uniref:hypothetical protein n=1 Tax=Variovorax saccharolyticus TaxID=3053516 RepID=UPI0025786CDE|nr:hypothetical protein [Variovorax sp. J31P216]MDM0025917.1 hypothetical protein [Variovorax sp. J31P216]
MAQRQVEGSPGSRLLVAALAGLVAAGLALLKPARGAPVPEVPSAHPVTGPGVADAKMPEELKLRLEHHLQIERIIFDKLLIGLLLVVAGFGVNVLVEGIKAAAAQTQYLLDKRLDAAMAVRASLDAVTAPLYQITLDACEQNKENEENEDLAEKALAELRKIINTNSLLFDEQYMNDAEGAVAVLDGVLGQDCYARCDVTEFIEQVSQYLTDESRQQVMPGGNAAVIAPRGKSFKPLAWTPEGLRSMKTSGYMNKNYEAWRTRQGSVPEPTEPICRVTK